MRSWALVCPVWMLRSKISHEEAADYEDRLKALPSGMWNVSIWGCEQICPHIFPWKSPHIHPISSTQSIKITNSCETHKHTRWLFIASSYWGQQCYTHTHIYEVVAIPIRTVRMVSFLHSHRRRCPPRTVSFRLFCFIADAEMKYSHQIYHQLKKKHPPLNQIDIHDTHSRARISSSLCHSPLERKREIGKVST